MFALSQIWGNGKTAGAAPLATRALSGHSMHVFDTDSSWVVIESAQFVGAGTAKQMALAIGLGAVGDHKPMSWTIMHEPSLVLGRHRSRQIALGGSGIRRVFIANGAQENQVQACGLTFFVAPGSSVTRVSPFGPWIGTEGYGSMQMSANLGWYTIGGVLQGGGYAAARADSAARIAQIDAEVLVVLSPFTNDFNGGQSAATIGDECAAFLDGMIALGFTTSHIYYITQLRRIGVDASAVRLKEVAACDARGITSRSGLTIVNDADMANDGTGAHLYDTGDVKVANDILAWLASAGHTSKSVLIHSNSIMSNGQYIADDSTKYAAKDSVVAYVRAGR